MYINSIRSQEISLKAKLSFKLIGGHKGYLCVN